MAVNVAVIGVGAMGYHHARNYAEIPAARLVAVADLDEARGQEVAARFGCRFYRDYREMLEREELGAVSLVLPTSLHYRVALEIIAAGVPVLVEKPLAGSLAEAEELVRSSERAGAFLAVGHIERFNPGVQELKRRIDRGELGEVTSIVAKRVGMLPARVRDANVIIDLAVHDIDILGYLLGELPTEVYAAAGRALLSDRLDHAELFLKYGEVGCFIQVNWITPLKVRSLSVTGNQGYAELNYVTQELQIYQSNLERHYDDFGQFVVRFGTPQALVVPVAREEPLRLELEEFLRAVESRDGGRVMARGEDGVRALAVAEWAMESLLAKAGDETDPGYWGWRLGGGELRQVAPVGS